MLIMNSLCIHNGFTVFSDYVMSPHHTYIRAHLHHPSPDFLKVFPPFDSSLLLPSSSLIALCQACEGTLSPNCPSYEGSHQSGPPPVWFSRSHNAKDCPKSDPRMFYCFLQVLQMWILKSGYFTLPFRVLLKSEQLGALSPGLLAVAGQQLPHQIRFALSGQPGLSWRWATRQKQLATLKWALFTHLCGSHMPWADKPGHGDVPSNFYSLAHAHDSPRCGWSPWW